MKTNNIEYVLSEMGKPVSGSNTDERLAQFVTMEVVDNPITNITPRLIRDVMDTMIWPKMGKTQVAVNVDALRHYNAVIRHFKNEAVVIRIEAEAEEAVGIVLRRRGFT